MSKQRPKPCVDCKHYRSHPSTYATAKDGKCLHPSFMFSKFSPIDGELHRYNSYGVDIEFAREESKKCGKVGKLWEPMPPRKEFSLLGWLRGANH